METLLALLQPLVGLPATLGIFLGAALAASVEDWRLSILGLLVEYLLVTLLLSRVIQPEVAFIKLIAGAMAGIILYLSARQLRLPGSRPPWPARPHPPPTVEYLVGFPFRLVAVLLLALVSYALLLNYPRPEMGRLLNFAAYWLPASAFLILILTSNPFKVGVALLLFQLGFEAYYATLEGSLSIHGLLGIITLMVALTTSYLMLTAYEAKDDAVPGAGDDAASESRHHASEEGR